MTPAFVVRVTEAFERRLKKGKPTAEPRHSAVQSGEPW